LLVLPPAQALVAAVLLMTPLERLKSLTRPMAPAEVDAFLVRHYGALSRENISSDESALLPEDIAQLEQERAKAPK